MERNRLQQIELDQIEKKVLKVLFGGESIPDKTAALLQALHIDPNRYIREFEARITPLMKERGEINGQTLKSLIQIWKPKLNEIIDIPDEDFFVSDYIDILLNLAVPGVNTNGI